MINLSLRQLSFFNLRRLANYIRNSLEREFGFCLAQFFKCIDHELGVNNIHHFLEFISSIFSHDFKTACLIQPIIIVDLFIHSGGNTASLKRWQNEYLWYFCSEFVVCQMGFKHCEESYKLIWFCTIDQEVVPEGRWFNWWCTFNEERKKSLCVEILLVESCVWKSNSLNLEIFTPLVVNRCELGAWLSPLSFLKFKDFLYILVLVSPNCTIMFPYHFFNVIDLGKERRLFLVVHADKGDQPPCTEANSHWQVLIALNSLFFSEELRTLSTVD